MMEKIGIVFKSDESALDFQKKFNELSLSAKTRIKENKMVITVESSEDATKVRSLIREEKERLRRDTLSSQLIESINGCIQEDKARNLRLRDGSMVRLTPVRARAFVDVHDRMTEENQTKIRRLVVESNKAFSEIMDFCKQRSKTDGNK